MNRPAGDTAERLERLSPERRALLQQLLMRRAAARSGDDAPRRAAEGPLPLSFSQQRLWFLHQLEPESPFYNVAGAVRLSGVLDAGALRRALGEVVRRHEVLRTRIVEVDGVPAQEVGEATAAALPLVDLAGLADAAERSAAGRRLVEQEGRRPFSLARGEVLRAVLVRLGEGEHVLALAMHHAVSDGWSLGVLLRELGALYAAFAAGRESPLPPLPLQYADYASWQRERLDGAALEAEIDWWRERLAGAPATLELPADRPRPAVQSHLGGQERILLPAELRDALRAVGREADATPFMTLLAAFQVLLQRYTGQDDFLVGSPVAGRTRSDVEGLIGFFVNTLVLRAELDGDPTFLELLARVRGTALGAFAHQEVPFERLLEALRPERTLSHAPLFQAMFVLQDDALASSSWPGLEVAPEPLASVAAKFDLTLSATETADGIRAALEYSTDLFDAATARRMLDGFRVLLEGIAASPRARVSALPLLPADELRRVVVEWNDTAAEVPARCIHHLFQEQAERTPEAEAVVSGGVRLTYAELNRRANLLARRLAAAGVGPEVPVGLLMERSAGMLVAVLGILKAGGAYVPLDPAAPPERLAFILGEARAPAVVTREHLLPLLPEACAAGVVCLDDRDGAWPRRPGSEDDPEGGAGPDNLAYVIYTSGSTGTPKGVMVQHASVANLAAALYRRIYAHHGGPLRIGLNAPLVFDGSVKQVVQLLAGHAVHMLSDEARHDPAVLAAYLRAERLDGMDVTPSQLRVLLAEGVGEAGDITDGPRPAFMLVGGEAVDEPTAAQMARAAIRFYNVYGPTECTVDTTACEVVPGRPAAVIGRPLANVRTYVLDRTLTPVPVGVAGELYVGGAGVARGYLSRPEMTADRFVPDPFGPAGGRLYRTGDRVRYRPGGDVEFIGRVDGQVKLRGFRIELGEVEAALRAHPAVRACAVVVREDAPGDRRLVGYVVAEGRADLAALRDHLRARLPEYMVPAALVPLEALPLTASGKLDRRSLPAPDRPPSEGAEYAAPRTPAEEVVAAVWSGVLGVERVGAHDDFFELGGHSLLATQVVSRVRQAFGVNLPLRAVFEAPTVAGMAAQVARLAEAADPAPPLVPLPRTAPLPLSFAQERLWFLHRLEPDSPVYNVAGAVRLSGPLDAGALERALGEVVRRHEVLRTRFVEVEGVPAQEVLEGADLLVDRLDLAGRSGEERDAALREVLERQARLPFRLDGGELLRAALVRTGRDEHVLALSMHHVVSDGWSLGVLLRELEALYPAFAAGGESPLPPPAIQYADFAAWQRQWLAGGTLEVELAWWRERLAGAPPTLELPTDRPRPAMRAARGAELEVLLPADLAARLRALARAHDCTPFMVLLGAWQLLLSRYAGEEDVCVGSPVAGRTRPETEGLIGFFVNTLVLRTDLSGDPGFAELLRRVREVCLGAYAHQDVPFEKLVEELHPRRDPGSTPLFQVMFAFQNAAGGPLRLPGVDAEPVRVAVRAAKFDLTLNLAEDGDGAVAGVVEYATDLYEAATIARMAGHFRRLLAEAAAAPERPVSGLPLLDAAERRRVLEELNSTGPAYPEETLHGLFEAQARRTPGATAVVSGGERVSYAELDARAERLAAYLAARGVGPEARVGVCLDRSAELVVALLGVLKAGGAYVPLDPGYPPERLAFMAGDSGAAVLVTREALEALLPDTGAHRVRVDADAAQIAAAEPPLSRSRTFALPHSLLAYLIYTSGSTGRPKGVQVEHRSASRVVHFLRDAVRPEDRTAVLGSTSASFDVSVGEIFGTLCWGGTLVLVENVLELPRVAGDGVRLVVAVPSAVAELLRAGGIPESVRAFNLAGEALPASLARELYELPGTERVLNLYGPTEDTVYSTWCEVERGAARVRIGRPLPGSRAYVLDRTGGPAPVGVPGELCLAGAGTARGYHARPDLTAERFVPDPFAPGPGGRMYRTGDGVRWLADGELEYLGRIDQQVKVRGFRIEPGEVEAALRAHPGVRAAAVRVRDGVGGPRLVGWIVPASGHVPPAEELRRHLRGRLPEHMVPGAFVTLDALPLGHSGKLDARALPTPAADAGAEYEAPRTPDEEVLAAVWARLLEVERVGAHDSFFDLGGHSLLATRLASRVRELFGVELPLRAVFESPTLAGMAAAVAALRGEAGAGSASPIPPAGPGPHPLSFAQQRLWFLDQLQPDTSFYNLTSATRLRGALDAAALRGALTEVARRHETLRTVFGLVDGEPAQVVAPPGPFPLREVDLAGTEPAAREAELRRRFAAEAGAPFDLARGPLVRCTLLRLSPAEHVLLVVMHHVIGDGWSTGVFVREVQALYSAFLAGRPSPLEPLPVRYADWAVWQREWLSDGALEAQLAWWRARLDGAPPALALPTDHPRPPVQSFAGAHLPLRLPPELDAGVRELARVQGCTVFMVLLGAWQLLLARYAGEEDVCVGSPVAGRTRPETEGLIGFFVNTLVLRTDLGGDPSFRELLGRVRETALGAYAHQDVPFEKLVEELAPERDLSRSPLFQVMLALQNAPMPALSLPGLEVEPVEGGAVTAKFDLMLALSDTGGGLAGVVEYATDLFEHDTVARMAGHFLRLLEGAVAAPERPVSELPILADDERARVLVEFNRTSREYPRGTCVHALFERQAARTPHAPALERGAERLTYRELDERSSRLAARLRGLGVGPDVRVAVLLERTPALVVALLGVMKAGGAYVPLDPQYPRERLAFMLDDSGSRVLLTQGVLEGVVPADGVYVLHVDAPHGEAEAGAAAAGVPVGADNLAYVIYTSGSTGRPKGVAIEHRSAAAFIHWAHEVFTRTELSRVLASTSVCFDLSVFEIFVPLSCGGAVVLVDDALSLAALGAGEGVTLVNTVPSAINELARAGAVPASVKVVNLAGEALKQAVADAVYDRGVEAVWNLYGPTEDTTYSTFTRVERRAARQPTIGRPIANTRAYVLDRDGRPAPLGVAGELLLAGDGLARGYLGRPDLTAEKFVPDPFSATPGERMYRTGDRARWRADGEIEYLGRADHQLKVRGFRIELGEIEAVLVEHPGVTEAAVLVRGDGPGGARIVAYVAAHGSVPPSPHELRAHLRERLPEYMVPAAFVVLEALPLTPNGKLDRRALPEPAREPAPAGTAPRTPTEEVVAGVWADVLAVARVGMEDGFFELGGHSLLATRAVSRLREALGVSLPLRTLFEHPTVEAMARQVEAALAAGAPAGLPPIVPLVGEGPVPLSFAQQRLWFLHRLDPASAAYNVPVALRLRGALDIAALRRALGAVALRHEPLRTRFVDVEGDPVQVVDAPAPVPLPVADLSGLPAERREAEALRLAAGEACRPFDLAAGPVLRARLLRLAPDDHLAAVTLHHIVADGGSLEVLVAELSALYGARVGGGEARLPALPVRYADYVAWQRGWLAGPALEGQLAYWRGRLAGAPRAVAFPGARPPGGPFRGAGLRLEVPADTVEGLRALARREGATLHMVLLAAFDALLFAWTGREDLVVGTPVAARQRPEVEPLIGFFVNTLALRTDLSGDPPFRELLGRVRESALSAYAHQDLPFDRVVEELSRGADRSPLFQAYFNLLGFDAGRVRLPGLEVDVLDPAPAIKFDLELLVTDTGAGLRAVLGYNALRFDEAAVRRTGERLVELLTRLPCEAERPLRALLALPAPAAAALPDGFNDPLDGFNDPLDGFNDPLDLLAR